MKRRILGMGFLVAFALVATARPRRADATFFMGWADEFLLGHVHCRVLVNGCYAANHWAGSFWMPGTDDLMAHLTWSYVGQQGGNPTGRANARAKVMVTFRDDDTSFSGSQSITLSRQRTGIPGAEGAACFGHTFVGSVTQTYETTSLPPSDTKYNNRMLPVMDFSLESFSGGMTIGYNDTIVLNGPMGSTAQKVGCYKIQWN